MSTNGTSIAKTATATDTIPTTEIGASSAPEQLTLLMTTSVPLQFRLNERTRRTGLQHVAALRAQMAAQAEARNLSDERKRPAGRSIAA